MCGYKKGCAAQTKTLPKRILKGWSCCTPLICGAIDAVPSNAKKRRETTGSSALFHCPLGLQRPPCPNLVVLKLFRGAFLALLLSWEPAGQALGDRPRKEAEQHKHQQGQHSRHQRGISVLESDPTYSAWGSPISSPTGIATVPCGRHYKRFLVRPGTAFLAGGIL